MEFERVGWLRQENILRTTPIFHLEPHRITGTITPVMYGGRAGPFNVLVKVAAPKLTGTTTFTLTEATQYAKNAEACWQVAKGLGLQRMVPITVAREVTLFDGQKAFGSVQYLWPQFQEMPSVEIFGTRVGKLNLTPLAERRWAAMFDLITNQCDRHFGNYTCDVVPPHHLRLYDLDFSFLTSGYVGQNEIIVDLPDLKVPQAHLDRLEEWLNADHTIVQGLLTPEAYDDHLATCRHVLKTRRLERPPGTWGRP